LRGVGGGCRHGWISVVVAVLEVLLQTTTILAIIHRHCGVMVSVAFKNNGKLPSDNRNFWATQ
jgi:hypothetical protein